MREASRTAANTTTTMKSYDTTTMVEEPHFRVLYVLGW